MNELALVAMIGMIGTILGGVATYLTTMRKVNADVHIARVTLESEEEADDRKALRDFQNAAIARREQELAECKQENQQLRQELGEAVHLKERGIHTLDDAIEVIKAQKGIIQQLTQTGGHS